MTDDERRHAAQAILEVPFFHQLWEELEQAAVNACIFCPSTDHEKRLAHAVEARTIRQLLSRLKSIAADDEKTASRRAPA